MGAVLAFAPRQLKNVRSPPGVTAAKTSPVIACASLCTKEGSTSAQGALRWVQAETGQRLGQLILEPSVDASLFVQDDEDFGYFIWSGFLYAIGPAAPDRAGPACGRRR